MQEWIMMIKYDASDDGQSNDEYFDYGSTVEY